MTSTLHLQIVPHGGHMQLRPIVIGEISKISETDVDPIPLPLLRDDAVAVSLNGSVRFRPYGIPSRGIHLLELVSASIGFSYDPQVFMTLRKLGVTSIENLVEVLQQPFATLEEEFSAAHKV